MCVFLLSLTLLHLDFSLNNSDYILSTIKIHQVRADYRFMLKRAHLDVRQRGDDASACITKQCKCSFFLICS